MLNTIKPDGAEQGLGNPSTGLSPEHAPPLCPTCRAPLLAKKTYKSVEALMRDSNLPKSVWKEYRRLKKLDALHEDFGKWHAAHSKDKRLRKNKS